MTPWFFQPLRYTKKQQHNHGEISSVTCSSSPCCRHPTHQCHQIYWCGACVHLYQVYPYCAKLIPGLAIAIAACRGLSLRHHHMFVVVLGCLVHEYYHTIVTDHHQINLMVIVPYQGTSISAFVCHWWNQWGYHGTKQCQQSALQPNVYLWGEAH